MGPWEQACDLRSKNSLYRPGPRRSRLFPVGHMGRPLMVNIRDSVVLMIKFVHRVS